MCVAHVARRGEGTSAGGGRGAKRRAMTSVRLEIGTLPVGRRCATDEPRDNARGQSSWRGRISGAEVAIVMAVYLFLTSLGGVIVEASGYGELSPIALPLLAVGGFVAAALSVGLVLALPTRATAESIGLVKVSGRWLMGGVGLGLLGWALSLGIGILYDLAADGTASPRPAHGQPTAGAGRRCYARHSSATGVPHLHGVPARTAR